MVVEIEIKFKKRKRKDRPGESNESIIYHGQRKKRATGEVQYGWKVQMRDALKRTFNIVSCRWREG